MLLQGKKAVITGGTTGIGFETAALFVREGAKVLFTGQNEDRIREAQRLLGANAVGVRVLAQNRSDDEILFDLVKKNLGQIDILFLNAGITTPRAFAEVNELELEREFATNFKGPFFTAQKLVPIMNRKGAIVFNTSLLANRGVAGVSVYSATKGALKSLAQALAQELLPLEIRVNSIAPGPILTPIHQKTGSSPENVDKMYKFVSGKIPLGRLGEPREVAQVALFLASDMSSYLTGVEIPCDGGWSSLGG